MSESAYEEVYHRERYRLIWRLSVAFALVFALLTILFYNNQREAFYIYLAVFLLSVFSLFWLKFSSNYKLVFWLFSASASALVLYSVNTIIDTMHYSDLLWMVNIVLFAYVGLSRNQALIFVILHVFGLAYYCLFQLNDHLEVIHPLNDVQIIVTTIEMVFAFIVMAYLYHANIRFQRFVQEEIKEVNEVLEAKNTEITTLLKEVHHRVKNNLQIVVSLLRIQQSELDSDDLRAQFEEAVNRIMTIAAIHQKLYQSNELSNVQFNDYIKSLLEDFQELFDHRNVKFNFASNVDVIDLKTIVPLGLILNELITNSIKHGDVSEMRIDLTFNETEEGTLMVYDDYIVWNSEGTGFGLELIQILGDQIDGKMRKENTRLILEF